MATEEKKELQKIVGRIQKKIGTLKNRKVAEDYQNRLNEIKREYHLGKGAIFSRFLIKGGDIQTCKELLDLLDKSVEETISKELQIRSEREIRKDLKPAEEAFGAGLQQMEKKLMRAIDFNIWYKKIEKCDTPDQVIKVMKELENVAKKLGGLTGDDYWDYHKLKDIAREKIGELSVEKKPYEKQISEEESEGAKRMARKERFKNLSEKLSERAKDTGGKIKKPFTEKIVACPRCGSTETEIMKGKMGRRICKECGYEFDVYEYQTPVKRLFKRGKTKAYEGKPSENVEKYAKIILPIAAIFIGIIILTLLPGLWIIGIPAIIIGIGYLLIVAPEMDKFSFKQKIGALIIITGGLLAFVFGVIWYGLALLFLGGAFIVYDWIPKGKGRLAIKIIELGATLALLILIVPAFLNWAGISISLGALIFFSGLNTFLLFMLWSFSSGQSIKESLEEELLASKEETEKLLQDKIKKEIERLDKLAKKRDESGPKMEKLYNWILKRREKKLDKLKDKKESLNGEEDKSKEGEEE